MLTRALNIIDSYQFHVKAIKEGNGYTGSSLLQTFVSGRNGEIDLGTNEHLILENFKENQYCAQGGTLQKLNLQFVCKTCTFLWRREASSIFVCIAASIINIEGLVATFFHPFQPLIWNNNWGLRTWKCIEITKVNQG